VREQELLRHIYGRSTGLTGAFPHVRVGPGDDCAVIHVPTGGGGSSGDLLLKVDQLVAGRHFRPYPATPIDLIARKAIARPVSDIAAMGGAPLAALAAATLPPGCAWANELFDRMAHWAGRWGCPLVGGDIGVAGQGAPLVLSVTVVGTPHPVRGPVLRSGAKPGDAIHVTGPLGGSLDRATGLGRHLTFEPRLAEAGALCDALGERLHAMMDLSDGLGLDAARLAEASRVRLEIDAAAIPRAPGVEDWRSAAGDGEDYELLFATPDATAVPGLSAGPSAGSVRIGRVTAGSGCVIIDNGRAHDARAFGWEH
jgi:thiamine-monophosphate kinase